MKQSLCDFRWQATCHLFMRAYPTFSHSIQFAHACYYQPSHLTLRSTALLPESWKGDLQLVAAWLESSSKSWEQRLTRFGWAKRPSFWCKNAKMVLKACLFIFAGTDHGSIKAFGGAWIWLHAFAQSYLMVVFSCCLKIFRMVQILKLLKISLVYCTSVATSEISWWIICPLLPSTRPNYVQQQQQTVWHCFPLIDGGHPSKRCGRPLSVPRSTDYSHNPHENI